MKRREFIRRAIAVGISGPISAFSSERAERIEVGKSDFNVRRFGAGGAGARLDTKAIQEAIDRCAAIGGGTVWFPEGVYLSGTIFLRSRVALHLEHGAVLLGSERLHDYPPTIPVLRSYTDNYTERSLLYGENLESVAIKGQGTIDGQGTAFKGPYKLRPYLLRLVSSRRVTVKDLMLKNSAMWVQHYLGCDEVMLNGLTVRSKVNANNDGIDIDGCQHVRIANCDISSGDDALVLKSTFDRPCKDVVVSNCILSSDCNAFKLGTESNGGFHNIALSNCTIYDTKLAGLALELVDGGSLDRVSISNLTMHKVSCPIFIRLGNRARPFKADMAKPGRGQLRNVSISHIQADGANRIGCSITGLPGQAAAEISLDEVSISCAGGGKRADAERPVPEEPGKYPEYSMFGTLPAYGFYCRHVHGLRLRDVAVVWREPDQRPSLFCDEVEDVDLFGWRAAAGTQPIIRFRNVRRAFVHGCRSPETAGSFLRVEGQACSRIRMSGNDLTEAGQAVELGPEVNADAIVNSGP